LYLEKHQGTYTTQCRTKKGNRVCERLLHEIEFLGAAACRLCPDYTYPQEELKKIWQELLLYQFHDILPGSCIARVYVEAEARYAELEKQLLSIKEDLLSALLTGDETTLLNVSPFENEEAYLGQNGYILPGKAATPYSFRPLRKMARFRLHYTDTTMENEHLQVTFLPDGSISSVMTGTEEHLRAPGNLLRVFEDMEDGWEVPAPEKLQKEFKVRLTSARTVRKGAALVRTQRYVCGKNVILQKIILRADSQRLEFVTEVDWKDSHRILRTEFPLLHENENALCGIQFGAVNRPTTQNTTWEQAKREVCFHKYVDVCDREDGAAILSDSKYGVCLRDCNLSLALLRTPTYPGEGADLGHHSFAYSFYPHKVWEDVVAAAYNMEYPLQQVKGTPPFTGSFVWAIDLCVETVKPAEDGRGVIVRLYNPHNSRVTSYLNVAEEAGFKKCISTNLLEQDAGEISPLLHVGPYEIVTLRLV
jgi:alpha-mannosidase